MTEQLFIKQFGQLPEGMKKELLAFFESLLIKYKKDEKSAFEKKASDEEPEPSSGKSLPIVKIERSGIPVALKFGSGKHLIKYIADDFNAPLDEFKEYM
jgi:hypothetical protein